MSEEASVVIGTPKHALYIKVRDNAELKIKDLEDDLDVNREVLKMANTIIEEEKLK